MADMVQYLYLKSLVLRMVNSMSPLREFRSLLKRIDNEASVDCLRRYYLIFEGANTERKYFMGISNNRKELGINNDIELVILLKEGEIKDYSHPQKLLELIKEKKKQLIEDKIYDEQIDQFIIVFDRDSFENKETYIEFIKKAKVEHKLAITSPCFEIWLLLHYNDSLKEHIKPNKEEIVKNNKISSSHTYTSKLFSDVSGMNAKTNSSFPRFKNKIDIAIQQEKEIEQSIIKMAGAIGSNIGQLIEQMRKDPREGSP
jgi:hypothetical protein